MPVRAQADLSRLHVIVPVRGLGVGKSRLGGALDAEERLTLVVGLLIRTLTILTGWEGAARIHLVTGDADLRRLIRNSTPNVDVVADDAPSGLNAALRSGLARAIAHGATAVLYLPADLPLLSTEPLDSLLGAADAAIAAGSGRPIVVIAPADARSGTNALLVSPADTIGPQFGVSSLSAHLRAAAAADASVQLFSDATLGFDLDTPDDLERLEAGSLLTLHEIGQRGLDAAGPHAASAEVA